MGSCHHNNVIPLASPQLKLQLLSVWTWWQWEVICPLLSRYAQVSFDWHMNMKWKWGQNTNNVEDFLAPKVNQTKQSWCSLHVSVDLFIRCFRLNKEKQENLWSFTQKEVKHQRPISNCNTNYVLHYTHFGKYTVFIYKIWTRDFGRYLHR